MRVARRLPQTHNLRQIVSRQRAPAHSALPVQVGDGPILGIDPGTASCGWAVVGGTSRERLVASGTIRHRSDREVVERIYLLKAELVRLVRYYHPVAICVEDYSYIGKPTTNWRNLPMLVGACIDLGMLCCPPAPAVLARAGDWGRTLVGTHTSHHAPGKEDVARVVRMRLGDIGKDSGYHQSDAAGLALWLKDQLAGQVRIQEAQDVGTR